MEAEPFELSEIDSKTDKLAVTEEAYVDEATQKNETHNHINRKWTLILIRLIHLN